MPYKKKVKKSKSDQDKVLKKHKDAKTKGDKSELMNELEEQPKTKGENKIHSIKRKWFLIIGIIVTVIAILGAALFSVVLYKNDKANKAAAALDALPRITVPAGHFKPMKYEYTFLKNMKAVKLTPKVDLYTDIKSTQAALEAEVDTIIKDIKTLGFNSLIIDTKCDQSVIFNSTLLEKTPVDLLSIIVKKAKPENISVVAVYNATGTKVAGKEVINSHLGYTNKAILFDGATELVNKYELDSVLIDNYYVKRDADAYAQFMNYGGIGNYDEWLVSNTTATVDGISQSIKSAKNSLPVGLVVNDVWASLKENEKGCKTEPTFTSLKNGYADTKAMVESHIVDFVNVKISTSIDDKSMPFKTISTWWGDLCKASNMPLYITQSGESANSKTLPGWDGTDQLARQASIAIKTPNYYGGAFSGIKNMMANMTTSTDILLKYLKNEYGEAELFKNLEISSPKKVQFTTYEENVQFRGKFDANQEVLLNGVKVKPSEKGGFSIWVPLKIGKNTVALQHKGKTTNYIIERKVIILKTVSPTKALKVAGSSEIEFNVMAYKGSKITASINGTTVTLKEGGAGEDNVADSAYVNYQATFKCPKAKAKDQNIGRITFAGLYQGYKETLAGSSIVIDKIPDEVDPDTATGQVFQHAIVNQAYANTYPFMTTPGYPQAILYPLPQGTQDIVESINGDFVNLRSGKTVKKSAVTLQDIPFEGNNLISQFSAGVEGNDTVIKVTSNWKAPFSITPNPYPTDPSQTKGYTFNSNSVTILLDYATTIAKDKIATDMSSSPIFSGISMERVRNESRGIYQYKVTLPLSRAGRYYGCHAEYEGNTLVLRFNHPPQSGSLTGLKIGLDVGHGGNDNGTMAGSDILEKNANMIMAEKLKGQLEALGAQVVMTRYDDSNPSLDQRVQFAHANKVDLFIACHHNSAGANPSPNGVETYFNAPFSQPLAQYIQAQLGQILNNRGAKCSIPNYNFVVTREKQFPSVLIEFGFLSNPGEEQKILDPTHQDNMARAAAQGVLDYYNAYN